MEVALGLEIVMLLVMSMVYRWWRKKYHIHEQQATAIPLCAPSNGRVSHPTDDTTYPATGIPYQRVGGPCDGAAPIAGAPCPAVAPYPSAGPFPDMPQPAAAPSVADGHTLPPSYDQLMSNEAKSPPYNLYAPH